MRMIPDNEPSPLMVNVGVSNQNYESDVRFSMQYTRWLLMLLGIWPYVTSNSTRFEKLLSRLLITLPPTIITIVVIPMVSIPFVRDIGSAEWITILTPISFQATSAIKNHILIARRDAIKLSIEHMKTDWRRIENENDRDIMMRNLRVGRGLTVTCVAFLSIPGTIWNVLPFLSPKEINSLNETVRPINIPGVDIYVDLQNGYNYEIVTFLGCFSPFYSCWIVITVCNLAAVLVCHACGQIQIVISRLASLTGDNESVDTDTIVVQKRIGFIIRTHIRVLRFASSVEELMRELCLIEVVTATLSICLSAHHCITEKTDTGLSTLILWLTLFVSLTFNIYIYCQIGELLKDQCQLVGKAAYMTEWYKLPGKTGLAVIMFIIIANSPRKLTAGRIIELSMTTFGNIMRTSFGYVNMLRNLTD